MNDVLPNIGICVWFIFIAVILTVPMWLGSPKDFWYQFNLSFSFSQKKCIFETFLYSNWGYCVNILFSFFRVVGVGALLTTAFACVFIFSQIVMDGLKNPDPVPFKPHTFNSFFLSFGTILFAFGGASTFPTIQNDMAEKQHFSKSIVNEFCLYE